MGADNRFKPDVSILTRTIPQWILVRNQHVSVDAC